MYQVRLGLTGSIPSYFRVHTAPTFPPAGEPQAGPNQHLLTGHSLLEKTAYRKRLCRYSLEDSMKLSTKIK